MTPPLRRLPAKQVGIHKPAGMKPKPKHLYSTTQITSPQVAASRIIAAEKEDRGVEGCKQSQKTMYLSYVPCHVFLSCIKASHHCLAAFRAPYARIQRVKYLGSHSRMPPAYFDQVRGACRKRLQANKMGRKRGG